MSINPYVTPPPPPEMALWWPLQHQPQREEDDIPMGIPIIHNPLPLRVWLPGQPQPSPLTWPGQGQNQPPPPPQTQPQPPMQQQRRQQRVPERMKEFMFEKALTPSDVGKLNRLVVPKSYALGHFPPGAATSSADGSKGMMLDFEDDAGKCWSFRYSYWSSSQSYVLTRGWSRYVKDNRLQPGDIVSFHRHRRNPNRRFVDWRPRPPGTVAPGRVRRSRDQMIEILGGAIGAAAGDGDGNNNNNEMSVGFGGGPVIQGWMSGRQYYPAHVYNPAPSYPPQPSFNPDNNFLLTAGSGGTQGRNGTTVAVGNSTRNSGAGMRLFGVNLEGPLADN